VWKLDRQLELLRRIHWIQLQRALRLTQCCREIAEIREGKAHVVMGFSEVGIRLNGTRERIASVRVFLELDENQADSIPRYRVLRRRGKYLTIRLQRQLDVLSAEQSEREVEPRLNGRVRPQ